MRKLKFLIFMSLVMTLAVLSWGIDQGWTQSPQSDKELRSPQPSKELKYRGGRITPEERKAAAKRARQLGLKPGVAGRDAQAPEPGGEQ